MVHCAWTPRDFQNSSSFVVAGRHLSEHCHAAMGWMRTILLGDIGNRLDIADNEEELATLKASQRRSTQALRAKENEIQRLKRELGEQKLAIQALTRFLVSNGTVDQASFDDFIREVDAEDGVVDGQMTLSQESQRLHFSRGTT